MASLRVGTRVERNGKTYVYAGPDYGYVTLDEFNDLKATGVIDYQTQLLATLGPTFAAFMLGTVGDDSAIGRALSGEEDDTVPMPRYESAEIPRHKPATKPQAKAGNDEDLVELVEQALYNKARRDAMSPSQQRSIDAALGNLSVNEVARQARGSLKDPGIQSLDEFGTALDDNGGFVRDGAVPDGFGVVEVGSGKRGRANAMQSSPYLRQLFNSKGKTANKYKAVREKLAEYGGMSSKQISKTIGALAVLEDLFESPESFLKKTLKAADDFAAWQSANTMRMGGGAQTFTEVSPEQFKEINPVRSTKFSDKPVKLDPDHRKALQGALDAMRVLHEQSSPFSQALLKWQNDNEKGLATALPDPRDYSAMPYERPRETRNFRLPDETYYQYQEKNRPYDFDNSENRSLSSYANEEIKPPGEQPAPVRRYADGRVEELTFGNIKATPITPEGATPPLPVQRDPNSGRIPRTDANPYKGASSLNRSQGGSTPQLELPDNVSVGQDFMQSGELQNTRVTGPAPGGKPAKTPAPAPSAQSAEGFGAAIDAAKQAGDKKLVKSLQKELIKFLRSAF